MNCSFKFLSCTRCWTNITCWCTSKKNPHRINSRKQKQHHHYLCLSWAPNHVQTWYIYHGRGKLKQPFFISPFLSDDVIRAPDLRLAAAATRCASQALPLICGAFATAQWDRMHSQGSCFLHTGLYRSLEPTGLPQAVSTVPASCTVVQTHRWESCETGYWKTSSYLWKM